MSTVSTDTNPDAVRLQRKRQLYQEALNDLANAPAFAKARYQTQVHRLASELLDSEEGARILLELAPEMASAGTFHAGPWEHASRLLPRLVGMSLRGDGVYPTIEALSELRMLAILSGRHKEDGVSPEDAEQFLQEVCVQNLDLMYPEKSEESRNRPKIYARAERLFTLIREHISLAGFGSTLIEEIETICAQRPIVTRRVQKLLDLARELPDETLTGDQRTRLDVFLRASGAVTSASAEAGEPRRYRVVLENLDAAKLGREAGQFAESIHETGLTSPYHAVLLRHVSRNHPELISRTLGLSPLGESCLEENRELVQRIVEEAIMPGTEIGVLGLAMTLNRGLLSRPEINAGMRRLLRVKLIPSAERHLLALRGDLPGLTARALLIAGTVSVLGLPLGIGQGNNPTCQAARGLSLWSQHAPGLLLKILNRAVRDGVVFIHFEQHELEIKEEAHEDFSTQFDLDLDPVSAVLVPLLDRLYARLMMLSTGRSQDAHRWVNPEMYGSWVPSGFEAAFHPTTGAVTQHEQFVRRFYATHHPKFNGGYDLLYPNPVGIIITDVHGNMLGYHAVSIQRIAEDPSGEMRIYFFNPNNEGRQRWGQGVAPTVAGNGEQPGESSLPFDQFVSRLYAYHYDRYEMGDVETVPGDVAASVSTLARESWGRAVTWMENGTIDPPQA